MDFLLSYIILAEIYVIAGMSTNILVGVVGIFTVSQAAVFGVGAYTVGALTVNAIMPFFPALLVAAILCIILNILVTLPALRVSGDYFVVTSFGIQLFASAIFVNWTSATGGAVGLFGIPPVEFLGYTIDSSNQFIVLSTVACLMAALCFWLVMRSPFGKLLRALREDEAAVAAAGKNVLFAKVSAAALAGALAGIAGGLYAAFISFIDPSSFELDASILLLTMVVVGGARTLAGSIIGPFLLLSIPQGLTLIDIPSSLAAPMRGLLYGVLLIAFMLLRPQGIAGQRI
jgi:branched-chain amino acid transport system permease protein